MFHDETAEDIKFSSPKTVSPLDDHQENKSTGPSDDHQGSKSTGPSDDHQGSLQVHQTITREVSLQPGPSDDHQGSLQVHQTITREVYRSIRRSTREVYRSIRRSPGKPTVPKTIDPSANQGNRLTCRHKSILLLNVKKLFHISHYAYLFRR